MIQEEQIQEDPKQSKVIACRISLKDYAKILKINCRPGSFLKEAIKEKLKQDKGGSKHGKKESKL